MIVFTNQVINRIQHDMLPTIQTVKNKNKWITSTRDRDKYIYINYTNQTDSHVDMRVLLYV
jgi:hypothetical protein